MRKSASSSEAVRSPAADERAADGDIGVWDESTPLPPLSALQITAATDVPGVDIQLIVVVHNKRRRRQKSKETSSSVASSSTPPPTPLPNLGLTIPNLLHYAQGPFKVDAIHNESPCAGSLLVGDVVIAVDRQTPTSNAHLARLLAKANSQTCCTITVRRPHIMQGQSEVRRRVLQDAGRSADNDHFIVYMEFRKDGPSLGLLIKHRQYKVLVSRVEPDTLTAMTLQRGDRIMDVNGQPVSDKEVAKATILDSMRRRVPFTLLVERPTSERAKRDIDELLVQATTTEQRPTDDSKEKYEILLPPDVQSVVRVELARRRQQQGHAPPTSRAILQPHLPCSYATNGLPVTAATSTSSVYAVEQSTKSTKTSPQQAALSSHSEVDAAYPAPPRGTKHTPVTMLTARFRRNDSARRSVSFTRRPIEHKIAVLSDASGGKKQLRHLGKRYT